MKSELVQRAGSFVKWGLALYGAFSIATNTGLISRTPEQLGGELTSGMPYTITTEPHDTPYTRGEYKYVIAFKDGITIEDCFLDGVIGPLDITNAFGNRVISSQQFSNSEGKYSAIEVNDTERRRILQRIVEVYRQQEINSEVRDS